MGTGRVRLIEIAGLDLQPCGGTHVRNASEIGAVRVTQIEKKGKQNRRVRIALSIATDPLDTNSEIKAMTAIPKPPPAAG